MQANLNDALSPTAEQEARPERAGTVELDASVNGKEMYAYMAAGCCSARTFYGFNKAEPEEILEGIVRSGIGGSMMFMTDAYSGDGSAARKFVEWVQSSSIKGLSAVMSEGSRNPYTTRTIFGIVLCYNLRELQKWLNARLEAEGKTVWKKPKSWHSDTDAVWMDHVFYQVGGRPKPKDMVHSPDWYAEGKSSQEVE